MTEVGVDFVQKKFHCRQTLQEWKWGVNIPRWVKVGQEKVGRELAGLEMRVQVVWVERRFQGSLRCAYEERGGNILRQRERWMKVNLQQFEGQVMELCWNAWEEGWLWILQEWK